MSETENKNNVGNGSKGSPIFLLLFVGFIFGLIVGFATKDQVVRSYSKLITKVVKETETSTGTPAANAVEDAKQGNAAKQGDAAKTDEEKKKEEEEKKKKEEEEKKKDEKKSEDAKPEEKKAE